MLEQSKFLVSFDCWSGDDEYQYLYDYYENKYPEYPQPTKNRKGNDYHISHTQGNRGNIHYLPTDTERKEVHQI